MIDLAAKFKKRLSKERVSVGLDIGTEAVKIVKLKFIKDAVELSAFALEPSQPAPADTLKKIKEPQGPVESVRISVSGSSAVIRYVSFPRMSNEELKQSLKFEAQKHIPFSIDEVNLDGYILKEELPDNKMLVLLAAVKKDLLNQRLKLIDDAGFKTEAIDIDSIALVNAFNFNYSGEEGLKNKTIALFNIGAAITNLNILENGLPRLSRDIHIAGNNFTHKLMDTFALDFNSAEKLKLNPQTEKSERIVAGVESVLANLCQEVRTSFDYYESESASSVVKIFLSGGGSNFRGLKDILANLLGIEVEYWDPLRKIGIPAGLDAGRIKALSNQLAVAVGLALRQQ
jgi:type IV pilus assembly protein PilM